MAGGISVSGISTGLDTSSIVAKLIELKRRPIDLISARKDILDIELSELQALNTKLLAFQSVTNSFSTSDKFLTKKASFFNNNSSDNNKVVTLTPGSIAASGSYSLVVNSLAKAEKEVSDGFSATSSSVSTGTFSIKVGSTTTNITIDSSNNTLEGLKNAINSSGAGVTATILNDGNSSNPYRLVISSNSTGTDNVITFSNSLGLTFTETQSAANASFTLDGIDIIKSSNTVTDVIEGATIKLESAGSGTVTIESDVDSVKTNIETFVSEYNELISFINDQFFFDTETGKTGILFGNTAVIDLQSSMRGIITSQVPGLDDTFITLAQIGITTNSLSGSLEISDGDLTDAITTDINAVVNLFIGAGSSDTSGLTFVGFTEDTAAGTYDVRVSGGQVQIAASGTDDYQDADGSGNYYSGAEGTSGSGLRFGLTSFTDGDKGTITLSFGVAAQFDRMLDNLTDKSKNGPLKSELDTLTSNISDIEDTIEEQEARLFLEEERLTKRFTALEVFVSKMQFQGDFLAQMQVGLLNFKR